MQPLNDQLTDMQADMLSAPVSCHFTAPAAGGTQCNHSNQAGKMRDQLVLVSVFNDQLLQNVGEQSGLGNQEKTRQESHADTQHEPGFGKLALRF